MTLTIQEACSDLYKQYKGRDFFHSIGHNGKDTITVYTINKLDGSVNKYYGFKVIWKKFGKQSPLK